MLLNLAQPTQPAQATAVPSGSVVWSPDRNSIAYTTTRPRGDGLLETIFAKKLAEGNSVDLLPDEMAVQSVSTSKEISGWFPDGEIAYHEHKGPGVQQLFLLNVENRKLFSPDKLVAAWFAWSESGERVAGQQQSSFWLWDRKERRFLTPKTLPGSHQWFEAWSPEGRFVVFTAWNRNEGYGKPGARPALYRLSVESGDVEKVDENAGLAALSGDLIAYVKFGERLTLVVAKASGGKTLWTDDLGELSKVEAQLPWGYQPTIATTFAVAPDYVLNDQLKSLPIDSPVAS